jgi:hypothetical protein
MAENIQVDLSLLNYYKDLYSGHKIIYVRFLGEDFVFRTLTRKEYKYLLQSIEGKFDLQDAVCNTSCIHPESYDFNTCGFAGLVEFAANNIIKQSGLENIQDVLAEYKQYKEYSNLEMQCMDLIKAFLPEYSYEEMEEWTWGKLMYMTARAEKIAELKGFDWHIEDQSDAYFEEINKITMDNKEFIEELKKNGIDPMYYFEDELRESFKRDILDFPLIGGIHWNDEVVLDVIRKQIRKKNSKH